MFHFQSQLRYKDGLKAEITKQNVNTWIIFHQKANIVHDKIFIDTLKHIINGKGLLNDSNNNIVTIIKAWREC